MQTTNLPPTTHNLKPNQNVTEAALATYGTILAVILSIAAFFVGFSKSNIFAILAFLPMLIYFAHELYHKLFTTDALQNPYQKSTEFSFTHFLLQDSFMFRISLSLFLVAFIAIFAKGIVSTQTAAQITTALTQEVSLNKPNNN